MKKILTFALLIYLCCSHDTFAQLKVKPDGFVGIGTNDPKARLHVIGEGLIDSYVGATGSAFSTRIHNKNTGAYHLWNEYFNKDVFFVNGEGWIWSSRGAYVGSDSSQLKDITPITTPLLSVMQLKGQRFRYRDDKNENGEAAFRFGLMAQEVEGVLPDVVRIMDDGTKSVAYTDLVPLLIEAIKEQNGQIQSLQMALDGQAEEIERIKRKRWFKNKTIE